MTVERMIEELKKCQNPRAQVTMHDRAGKPVLFVCIEQNGENVWLEEENDVDLGYQLECRFNEALESGESDIDVYNELEEMGIDCATYAKYRGIEAAEIMQDYLERGN